MPTQYSGRVTLIVVVLLAALFVLFPTGHLNLHPGIDMVGGVKLVYQIKPPEGQGSSIVGLSTRVMDALKKRVDPNGVRNLVWRPLGDTELEIEMPLSSQSDEAKAKRDAWAKAQQALEATNIRVSDVTDAVTKLTGDARDAQLAQLAQDSPQRKAAFAQLTAANDAQKKAIAANDPVALEAAEDQYNAAIAAIGRTNLSIDDLSSILAEPAEQQTADLAKAKADAAGFTSRLNAIDQFAKAYTDFQSVRNNLDDATALKQLLQGSGVLEFHILVTDFSSPDAQAMIHRLDPDGPGPGVQAGDTMQWYQVDKADEFKTQKVFTWHNKQYVLAWITPDKSMVRSDTAPWALQQAGLGQDASGERTVTFNFDSQGAALFGTLTSANVGKPLAIVLDNKIISAPSLLGPITGGNGQITGGNGGFSEAELNYLINTLNAGSLPATLADEPISEQTVGSTLGADNLRHGFIACLFGLVVVTVFLVGYYYVAGVVAAFAVMMNLVLILGMLAALGATFTLPSIAGIVLTVGTAVDANVLIFERLREEQHRGLPLRLALRNSYDRAFSAIIDSNMTSAITSLFLYWFGSEEVKGFGLTLLIGIAASLFTALFVTKTIFGLMIDKYGVTHLGSFPLSFPKWDKLLKPDIKWMSFAWVFYAFSTVAITGGMILFFMQLHAGKMLDIEFAAGTSVDFVLKQPTPIEDVRKFIGDANPDLPAPSIVAVGADNEKDKVYEVVTPNADAARVKAAVIGALGDKLELQLASRFDGVEDKPKIADAMNKQVFPINATTSWPDGWTAPKSAADYNGGVVIFLTHLNPKLTPKEIHDRLVQTYDQQTSADSTLPYRDFHVVSPNGDAPTDTAAVMVFDEKIPYAKNPDQWEQQLAAPMWKLVNQAIDRQGDLRKVTNFDASVADQARQDALVALTLSIIVIMAYIWIRFGNLKYGTATVVALLHDTLFTIAALGYSHYIDPQGPIGQVLQLEPFRINLTVVAGILTIMGYSMIDTIVVFDRIRENRGKYGHLDAQVIDDAVNQTLSRTLLTCGTTTVTVAFMYFLGGAGIHGFTFVLLVGILVGTYSSIAIAAPILLLGAQREQGAPPKPQSKAVGQLQGA